MLPITHHAIEQFQERSGCQDPERARKRIEAMLSKARPSKKRDAFWSLMNNGRDAVYHIYANWVLVESQGKIVTCYQDNPKRYDQSLCRCV